MKVHVSVLHYNIGLFVLGKLVQRLMQNIGDFYLLFIFPNSVCIPTYLHIVNAILGN